MEEIFGPVLFTSPEVDPVTPRVRELPMTSGKALGRSVVLLTCLKGLDVECLRKGLSRVEPDI